MIKNRVTYEDNEDLTNKMSKFQYICNTIINTLKKKTRKDNNLKFYYIR